jgi:TBC1 domain family protein 5
MMLDSIFVWCKANPEIGYRQGMHEILALILWVVERDAVDTAKGVVDEGQHDDVLVDIVDSRFIEHDTFTLFETVMRTAKSFYEPAPETGSTVKDTPMLARSSRIFDRLLPKVDPALSTHLVKLEIVPQIFLL